MKKFFKSIEVDMFDFCNVYYVLCDGKPFGIATLKRDEAYSTARYCRQEKGDNHRIEVVCSCMHIFTI